MGAKIGDVMASNLDFVKFVCKHIRGAYPGCEEASPYDGAKPHFLIENVDNQDLMERFISATYDELPEPKKKKIAFSSMKKKRIFPQENQVLKFLDFREWGRSKNRSII